MRARRDGLLPPYELPSLQAIKKRISKIAVYEFIPGTRVKAWLVKPCVIAKFLSPLQQNLKADTWQWQLQDLELKYDDLMAKEEERLAKLRAKEEKRKEREALQEECCRFGPESRQ